MCEISTIDVDWVIKGLHLNVEGIEVAIRPDHLGGVTCKKVFSTTSDGDLSRATKEIRRHLAKIDNRRRLHRELCRARDYVAQDTTVLRELALGRAAEFTFLLHALERMGV